MRFIAAVFAGFLVSCAAVTGSEFATFGDVPCSKGTVPLVRVFAKVDEQWTGKIVRFVYDVPGNGKPENVSVVSSEAPAEVTARAQEAFAKSRFKQAVVDGKLMRQLACQYDYVLPTGAQQRAPLDPPR